MSKKTFMALATAMLALAISIALGILLVRDAGAVEYRDPVLASWYGPGLYGNPLACGGRLYPGTVGVAHRYMRCGQRLRIVYRGRVLRTRVIDRGPFAAGRVFDLTAGARSRLGFPNGVAPVRWRYGWGLGR